MEARVAVQKRGWARRLFSFVGPAYLVSVGYMDPGNWATDIEGGARFGYTLIWVLLMSNLMAVLLQSLAAKLGIVTGYDLAQGCRREYPRMIRIVLWILAEIAIAATDLAEALGTILGLNLLFGLPLLWGCAVTACDTFLLLAVQRLGVRKMEAFIIMLVATIGTCFLIEIFLAQPDWGGIAAGFIPRLPPGGLYIAIGIIGATVMPHNLYLHSSLVQSRSVSNTYTGKAEAVKFNLIDSAVALNAAFFVNAAILVTSAANFHDRGILVTEIQQAHHLLHPLLGTYIAPLAFALALLASGQSSTLTGTISGQVVMEGFLNIRMRPWLRRLLTRSIALIPAIIVIGLKGSEGSYQLLILSQVILSLQLPFAIIPLIHFTSDGRKMGVFANGRILWAMAWVAAGIIVALNLKLAMEMVTRGLAVFPFWVSILILMGGSALIGILLYVIFGPLFLPSRDWGTGIITAGNKIIRQLKPMKVKHIGAALEHSPGDVEIVSAAVTLAKMVQARITLLHVVETPGTMLLKETSDSLHSREDYAYLENLARELESKDLPVETWLSAGTPVEEIVKAIEHLGLDMLVLGSHGHKGVEDVIFGQTVNSVRHAISIPLLIVRLPETQLEKPQRTP